MATMLLLTRTETVVTYAVVHVKASSKPEALMNALDAMDNYSAETGMGFSIEYYTTTQLSGDTYSVTAY